MIFQRRYEDYSTKKISKTQTSTRLPSRDKVSFINAENLRLRSKAVHSPDESRNIFQRMIEIFVYLYFNVPLKRRLNYHIIPYL